MRSEYDFDPSAPSPYAERARRPVTMRLDVEVVDYFKGLASQTGVPYQSLINLYLLQCARERLRPEFVPAARGAAGTGGGRTMSTHEPEERGPHDL